MIWFPFGWYLYQPISCVFSIAQINCLLVQWTSVPNFMLLARFAWSFWTSTPSIGQATKRTKKCTKKIYICYSKQQQNTFDIIWYVLFAFLEASQNLKPRTDNVLGALFSWKPSFDFWSECTIISTILKMITPSGFDPSPPNAPSTFYLFEISNFDWPLISGV